LLNGFRPMYHLRIRAQLTGQGIPVPTTDRYKRDKGGRLKLQVHNLI